MIYFLTGLQPYFDLLVPLFQRVQNRQATMILSVVTESELLVRPFRDRDAEAVERIGDLLSEDGIDVVEVSRGIARRAALLRANHGALRLPDATIIATAIDAGCDLIVGNDAEWSKLKDVPFARLDDIIKM